MVELSAEQVAQRAFDLNLVDERQLQEVWGQIGTRQVSGEEFQQLLLRREFLTNYQTKLLERGETSGYSGLLVSLYDADDNLITSVYTDSNGAFTFQVYVGSGDYYLDFGVAASYDFSPQDQGSDDTLDSDVDSDGITALFSLEAGDLKDDLDAGLIYAL